MSGAICFWQPPQSTLLLAKTLGETSSKWRGFFSADTLTGHQSAVHRGRVDCDDRGAAVVEQCLFSPQSEFIRAIHCPQSALCRNPR